MFTNKKITFIGAGAMGGAILRGMVAQGLVQSEQIWVADKADGVAERFASEFGVQAAADNETAVSQADVIILAIKPQGFNALAGELSGMISPSSLLISVLAGTPVNALVNRLDHQAVVRSMPNTPAMVGEGMTVWTTTTAVSPQQHDQARAILGSYGVELFVEQEKYLDMATALNGSGPAYVFLFIESMIDAGVHLGLPRPVAEKLVMRTVFGSTKYAIQSGRHVAELRNQVTSPGGTTAAALAEMEAGGLRSTVANGVWAAYKRSVELGK